jgi:hypothetical protein
MHWPNVCAAVAPSTGLDLREPISRLSGFPKCGRVEFVDNAVHKRVKRLLTSGGSSLFETYYSICTQCSSADAEKVVS